MLTRLSEFSYQSVYILAQITVWCARWHIKVILVIDSLYA